MRLVTCVHGERTLLGVWLDQDRLTLDLQRAAALAGLGDPAAFASMLDLIEAGEAAWDLARELAARAPDEAILASAECRLLAPLPRPTQMRDFLCFEGHLVGAFRGMAILAARLSGETDQALAALEQQNAWPIPDTWYRQPIYYTANRMAIAAPEEPVRRPPYCQYFDYELEFAAVIGKQGRDIARDSAASHIFGYTIYNDWSARDEQAKVMRGMLGPGKSKDFDQGVTLGPCIVTADELPDPYALAMKARVNGEQWSSGNSSGMHYTFEDCITDAARGQTIYPGEVFGSGTVGSGCGLEHGRFLEIGDTVELEVEGIGILRNTVAE